MEFGEHISVEILKGKTLKEIWESINFYADNRKGFMQFREFILLWKASAEEQGTEGKLSETDPLNFMMDMYTDGDKLYLAFPENVKFFIEIWGPDMFFASFLGRISENYMNWLVFNIEEQSQTEDAKYCRNEMKKYLQRQFPGEV